VTWSCLTLKAGVLHAQLLLSVGGGGGEGLRDELRLARARVRETAAAQAAALRERDTIAAQARALGAEVPAGLSIV
jgi:hypothetical protein